jgi:two-component system chemotaxis response regulator CheB
MPIKGRNIVVIGTSAGGLEAIERLVRQLPKDLPATIFVVQHMGPEGTGAALHDHIAAAAAMPCALAKGGETFRVGRIYIAPPDCHLLVKNKQLLVTKGARENRSRPGIDPLFRSAAVSHGARVIGVLLTGLLDDGTAGLTAIQRCGGVTIVQQPSDAKYPDMPQNALDALDVDHCVPIAEMGVLLDRLVRQRPGRRRAIPDDVRIEAEIAERVVSDVAQVNGLGELVPYNCPNCGGVLWKMDASDDTRYRCHTGHSFTEKSLLTSQTEKIEETMWICLRMLEERKNLLTGMAQKENRAHHRVSSVRERAAQTQIHIDRIRAILLSPKTPYP